MVNQTMLHLCEHIKLTKPHKNPLQQWQDASWVYSWKRLNKVEAMNTWLVFIRYSPEVFVLRNSSQFVWQRVPDTLDDRLPWTLKKLATLSHWDLVLHERSFFLGPNPPTSLPNDINIVPWRVEQELLETVGQTCFESPDLPFGPTPATSSPARAAETVTSSNSSDD